MWSRRVETFRGLQYLRDVKSTFLLKLNVILLICKSAIGLHQQIKHDKLHGEGLGAG
jgi:hypothetical protein